MIQLKPRAHQEDDVGILQRGCAPAPTDSGWLSGITPLPIGGREERKFGALDERAHFVFGARVAMPCR